MTEVRETARPAPPHQLRPHETDDARVFDLLGRMTLAEKLAQIVGFWAKEDGEVVAPLQGEFGGVADLDEFSRHGLGHLTRPYGTRPVDPSERASWLWAFQRGLVTGTRLGIPAIVHEECLTGLSVWKAATFPTPLAWGASSCCCPTMEPCRWRPEGASRSSVRTRTGRGTLRLLLLPQPRAGRPSRGRDRHRRADRPGRDAGRVRAGKSVVRVTGCGVDDDDRSGFAAAISTATEADVAVLVMGDRAGMFGRGTVGEGCDRDDLELPGVQRELVEAVLATGTPVILVLVTGRPYAVDWAMTRCAAVLQAFFPGEEGSGAIAGVLSGRVNPSGKLPVSLPRSAGAQPYSYLHPTLGEGAEVTNLSSTPAAPFGHGLSYTTFTHTDLVVPSVVVTDGALTVTVRATNTGTMHGHDVVQLYGRDLVGSVTRPVAQLLGYRRVRLAAGESVVVEFAVPLPAWRSPTGR